MEDPHNLIRQVMTMPQGASKLHEVNDELTFSINLPMRIFKRDPEAQLMFKLYLVDVGFDSIYLMQRHCSSLEFKCNDKVVPGVQPIESIPHVQFQTTLREYDVTGGDNLVKMRLTQIIGDKTFEITRI